MRKEDKMHGMLPVQTQVRSSCDRWTIDLSTEVATMCAMGSGSNIC